MITSPHGLKPIAGGPGEMRYIKRYHPPHFASTLK